MIKSVLPFEHSTRCWVVHDEEERQVPVPYSFLLGRRGQGNVVKAIEDEINVRFLFRHDRERVFLGHS